MSAEYVREQIAETLAKHQYAIVTSPLRPACMCGWEAGAEWSGTEVHDSHVAEAVLALLGEVTVTEEWTCVVDDCDTCGPRHRRTVVTTRRVGEWEVAE